MGTAHHVNKTSCRAFQENKNVSSKLFKMAVCKQSLRRYKRFRYECTQILANNFERLEHLHIAKQKCTFVRKKRFRL
jgi:hypothetical protein